MLTLVRKTAWSARSIVLTVVIAMTLTTWAFALNAGATARRTLSMPTPAVVQMAPASSLAAIPTGDVTAQVSWLCWLTITSFGTGAILAALFPPPGWFVLAAWGVVAADGVGAAAACDEGGLGGQGGSNVRFKLGCFTPVNYKGTTADGYTKYYWPMHSGQVPSCINSPWDA